MDLIYDFLNTVRGIIFDPTASESWGRTVLLPIFFSGFGAFAGAFVAYRFRKREEGYRKKREHLEKLSRICALSSAFCGTSVSIKRQLIKPAVDRYFESRGILLKELGTPTLQKKLVLDLYLMTYSAPATSPKDVLDAVLALGKGDGRNTPQAVALLESFNNFDSLCISRNGWIETFEKSGNSTTQQDKMNRFYSIPDGNGNVDSRYLHMMEGLRDSIDGMIFHSFEIYSRTALNLVDQSDKFQRQYGEKFNFSISDFAKEVSNGLFPDRANYSDWLVKPIQYNKPWYQRRSIHLEKIRTAIRSGYSKDV